jgi:hypothetical protein
MLALGYRQIILSILGLVVAVGTTASAQTTLPVTADGSQAYLIQGQANPTLLLTRGRTYVFAVNAPGHPFWIKTAPGTGTANAYATGISNNGIETGNLTFAVPQSAPDFLYYSCEIHSAMQGVILISDPPPSRPPFSNDPQAPTPNAFALGSNVVEGLVGSIANPGDYLRFEVPDGAYWTEMTLTEWTAELDTPGWIHVDEGSTTIDPAIGPLDTLLGAATLSAATYPASSNLLHSLAAAPAGGQGFSLPLGPGTYTLHIAQTNPVPSAYTLTCTLVYQGAPTQLLTRPATNNSLRLLWPASPPALLQATDDLRNPDAWTGAYATPSDNGGVRSVTLPRDAAQRYYRLRY